ncbi:MAG: hypothetical protein KGL39_60230 [Patescibacteria group bacterium]|nr:hypothetical protein [Patescibacteria group bacterium]
MNTLHEIIHFLANAAHRIAVIGAEVFVFIFSDSVIHYAAGLLILIGLYLRGRELLLVIKSGSKK